MKYLFIVIAAAMITACAGKANYEATPIEIAGQAVCCAVKINNTKDVGHVRVEVSKGADGSLSILLDETGVDASTPMNVQGQMVGSVADSASNIVRSVTRAASIGGAIGAASDAAPAAAAVISSQ